MAEGLTAGASVRAEEIIEQYSHMRPDNLGGFSTVLEGKYFSYAENLDKGTSLPAGAMSAWTGSTSHRTNLLNTIYQKLGVGYNEYDAGGISDSRFYWVQLFADNLKSPETVGTDQLLTANIATDTISKIVMGTDGNDILGNSVFGTTIAALGGNDSVNNSGLKVSISGDAGNDSIFNNGNSVSISGGDGTDTVWNNGSNVTMLGGTGDDQISLDSDSRNNFIRYAEGDGNDTVWGITENDTLNLLADGYSTVEGRGDDLIVNVITNDVVTGSVLLIGARNKPPHITLVESGTEGGNSSSGNGGVVSGGTSANEGMNSDASGNKSAIGSSGRSSRGSTVSNSSNVGRIRVSRPIIDTANETGITNLNFMTTSPQQTVATDNRIIYTGGDQVVPNYTADRKIFFLTEYVGSFYDGAAITLPAQRRAHSSFKTRRKKLST